MKKAILYFSTPVELKEFLTVTGIQSTELDQTTCSLVGEFTEAEIELALKGFGAVTTSLKSDRHQN